MLLVYKWKIWPYGSASNKGRWSAKWSRFILWGPWMLSVNLMGIWPLHTKMMGNYYYFFPVDGGIIHWGQLKRCLVQNSKCWINWAISSSFQWQWKKQKSEHSFQKDFGEIVSLFTIDAIFARNEIITWRLNQKLWKWSCLEFACSILYASQRVIELKMEPHLQQLLIHIWHNIIRNIIPLQNQAIIIQFDAKRSKPVATSGLHHLLLTISLTVTIRDLFVLVCPC